MVLLDMERHMAQASLPYTWRPTALTHVGRHPETWAFVPFNVKDTYCAAHFPSIIILGYTELLKRAAQPPALSPSLHSPSLSKLTRPPTPTSTPKHVSCRVFTLELSHAQLTEYCQNPLRFCWLYLGLEQPVCNL